MNSGITRAIKMLQQLLDLPQDGRMSDALIAAVQKRNSSMLIARLCDERLAFLKRLKTWPVFGAGWGRRVAGVRAAALAAAVRSPSPQAKSPPVETGARREADRPQVTATRSGSPLRRLAALAAAAGAKRRRKPPCPARRMARIVLNTVGSLGDLHPYLAVGAALAARGLILCLPAHMQRGAALRWLKSGLPIAAVVITHWNACEQPLGLLSLLAEHDAPLCGLAATADVTQALGAIDRAALTTDLERILQLSLSEPERTGD